LPTESTNCQVAGQLIREACARNTPVEFHHERNDGQLVTCRTRLLDVSGDRILAETPAQARELARIPLHKTMRVHLVLNGTRYEFSSAIEDIGLTARLNERLGVRALAIRMPAKIAESQRRASYRLSLAAEELLVILAPVHTSVPATCPVAGPHLNGRLINISAGGVAVLASGNQRRLLKVNKRLYVTFDLPGEEETFLMFASVRHARAVGSNESTRTGMAFQPWEGSHLRTESLRIARFIARHERKFLKRKR
jgi:c-di-GMP-binding flagellar brake protein YcgR